MMLIAVIGFLVVSALVASIVIILRKPTAGGKAGGGKTRGRKSGKGKDYDPYAWTQKSSSEVDADDDGGKSEEDESTSQVQDESNTPETAEEGVVGGIVAEPVFPLGGPSVPFRAQPENVVVGGPEEPLE